MTGEATEQGQEVVGELRRQAGLVAVRTRRGADGADSLALEPESLSHPNTYIYDYWLDNTLGAMSLAPVGALIASRRPANPVGWLL
jgi:hypothetical protein